MSLLRSTKQNLNFLNVEIYSTRKRQQVLINQSRFSLRNRRPCRSTILSNIKHALAIYTPIMKMQFDNAAWKIFGQLDDCTRRTPGVRSNLGSRFCNTFVATVLSRTGRVKLFTSHGVYCRFARSA